MKKSIFLFFTAILCASSVWGTPIDNIKNAYVAGTMNEWSADNTNWHLGSGNHCEKTFYVKKSDTNYKFKVVVDGKWYTKDGYWYTKDNSGPFTGLSTDGNDMQIETKNITTSTDYVALKFDFWGEYGGDSRLSVTQSAVSALSPTLTTTSTNLSAGETSTLKAACTGGSGTYGYTYKVTCGGSDVTSSTLNSTTGTSVVFTAPTASTEKTYTITVTAKDAHALLDGLSTKTATKTITVAAKAEDTNPVKVLYKCESVELLPSTTIEVGVETSTTVNAPEIAKYTFANWTLGADVATTDALTSNEIKITTKAGGSDFTLVANYEKAKLTYTVTVPAGTENCYLVGAMNGWDVDNPIEMTKQGENVFTTTLEGVATTDEYKYLSKKGSWDYADVQESNRTWTANDVVTAWKDPLATNVHLVGNMFANWDKTPDKEFRKATKDATTASIVVTLDANKDYELKVRRGDDWTSCTSKITNTVSNLQFSTSNNDNCKMKTTVAGDYTFTWTISSSKLAVTYPTICAITATANDAAMGTIAGAGDYGKGSTVTLTATPNDGYLFVNWTKGGEVVATTQEYSFTVTAAVELVANFEAAPEEVHNVTVSYVCGGNKIAEDQTVAAVGVTTPKTAEAPAIFGYTFESWTLGADVTTDDALTSNAIDINIVAGGSDFTLTANYTEIPKVTIYVVNNTKWDKVYAYGWGGSVGENPAWPGQDITANKEAEQIAGFDVHSYSVVPGSYVNIKFTNNSGNESANFKWTDGKYYYMDAANDYVGGTKEEVTKVLTPTYTVAGDSEAAFGTTWDPTNTANDMALEGGLYKWTKTNVALYANTKISFKVVKNHDWNKGQWPERDGENDNNWILQDGITADGLYTITITFNESTKEIQATATKTGDIVIKDFSNQPATLYFHPSFHWTSDAAHFAAYFYNNGPGADATPTWVNMTDGDGDGIYEVVNAKQHEYVIICRMNPSRAENNWDDEVMWNQIEHGITIPNTAGDLNTCLAFWKNCQGDVPTSECTWVAPTPLTDKNWADFVAAYDGKTINAVIERSFTSGQYHTLCLPFDIPTNWLGEGTEAYQLTYIVANNTGDKLSLNATKWETIVAGQPYIIVPVKGSEYEHIIINGVTVKNVSAGTSVADGAGYKATLKAVTATDGTKTNGSTEYYVGANDGKLYNAEVDKLGLRAIIELTTTGGQPLPPKVRAHVATGENVETGVEDIITTDAPVKVIENGQLIIIRGGVKYNVQGVRL